MKQTVFKVKDRVILSPNFLNQHVGPLARKLEGHVFQIDRINAWSITIRSEKTGERFGFLKHELRAYRGEE